MKKVQQFDLAIFTKTFGFDISIFIKIFGFGFDLITSTLIRLMAGVKKKSRKEICSVRG